MPALRVPTVARARRLIPLPDPPPPSVPPVQASTVLARHVQQLRSRSRAAATSRHPTGGVGATEALSLWRHPLLPQPSRHPIPCAQPLRPTCLSVSDPSAAAAGSSLSVAILHACPSCLSCANLRPACARRHITLAGLLVEWPSEASRAAMLDSFICRPGRVVSHFQSDSPERQHRQHMPDLQGEVSAMTAKRGTMYQARGGSGDRLSLAGGHGGDRRVG